MRARAPLLAVLVALPLAPVGGAAGAAAPRAAVAADRRAVLAVVQQQALAWNRGDAQAWGSYFARDADYVNLLGARYVGREANVLRHEALLADPFRGSRLEIRVERVRFVGGAAVLDTVQELRGWRALPPGVQATEPGLLRTRMQLVLESREGRWQIVTAQNTPVQPEAAPGRAATAATAAAAATPAAPAAPATPPSPAEATAPAGATEAARSSATPIPGDAPRAAEPAPQAAPPPRAAPAPDTTDGATTGLDPVTALAASAEPTAPLTSGTATDTGEPTPRAHAPPAMVAALADLDRRLYRALLESCAPAELEPLLTDDFEFLHDRAGRLARSGAEFVATAAERCAGRARGAEPEQRRELLGVSVEVHELQGYGALQSGTHRFLVRGHDGVLRPVEVGRFLHVWRRDEYGWRLARAIAFEHRPWAPAPDSPETGVHPGGRTGENPRPDDSGTLP